MSVSEELEIAIVPMGVTGREFKKRPVPKRYKKPKVNHSWRICHKFKCIKPTNRIAFLKSHEKVVKSERTPLEIYKTRTGFNDNKYRVFPMSQTCPCYVCGQKASVRHHVIPLGKGGRNRRNNIVPLCNVCHVKVHPHMQVGYRRPPVRPATKGWNIALSSYGEVASWNSVQPKINGPLAVKQEPQVVSLVAVGA